MKNNNYRDIFYWIYLIGFFAVLILPTVNVPPLFFPAAWGQSILFKIIFTIILVVFTAEILLKIRPLKEILIKLRQIKLPLVLFGLLSAIYIVATIFSLQPHFSFWGDPARAGGTLNFLLLQLFALLVFLVIKDHDWKKVLNFAFIGAIVVCLIAIAQQFSLIDNDILISYAYRPPGTLGNTDFLATYLLLLFFPALVLGLKETNHLKRVWYFGLSLFFCAVIILTISRAAYLGLGTGIFYFLFFYRLKNIYFRRARIVAAVILCIVATSLIYYANSRTVFPPAIDKTPVVRNFLARLSLKSAQNDARVSVWKNVCLPMLTQRPLLGYGPENFSIGFDKYYSPSFPAINKNSGSWWDKAHNIIFDTIFAIGIPGLIIYLLFCLVVLWKLEVEKRKENNQQYIIYHGMQTVFIAYFINNLFSFDTFATSLIVSLLLGYTFYLISNKPQATIEERNIFISSPKASSIIALVIISLAGCWFIYKYNIQPMQVVKQINYANYFSNCTNIQGLETALQSNTFLNTYLRLEYAGALRSCITKREITDKEREGIARKGVKLLTEAVEREPYYVRAWIYLSAYTNVLLDLYPEDKALIEASDRYFKKSVELSPGHSEIYAEWAKRYIHIKDYQQAIDKTNICISLNPDDHNCYFYKAIAYIHLKKPLEVEKNLALTKEKGYDTESRGALEYLAKSYIDLATNEPGNLEPYKYILPIYQKLSKMDPYNFQYHASLAYTYKILGRYAEAREEAMKVIKLSPASKQNVEEFLKTLPY
ncbi:MAG: hypothetical protein EXS48_00550 [Candidatus Staskawiczbacteria bacterium]|nr:hypothetical protein [Candidatus Staskawiczbacteria bacterium]